MRNAAAPHEFGADDRCIGPGIVRPSIPTAQRVIHQPTAQAGDDRVLGIGSRPCVVEVKR